MPEVCTCGAQLPPDARFCHRCGKPQRDEFVEVREPVTVPPRPAMPPGFRNPLALRVGLSAAGMVTILVLIPYVGYGLVIWLLAAGFLSGRYYASRTGQRLSVQSGARMGWITGVLTFAIFAIMFMLNAVEISQKSNLAAVRDQLRSMPIQQQSVDEYLRLMGSPAGVLIMLLMLFFIMTLSCVAGGALAAKVSGKD